MSTVSAERDGAKVQVFPAWPKEWNVSFRLLARGAFEVTASQAEGRIEFVELTSRAGGQCKLANPWAGARVTVYRDGKQSEDLSGETLTIGTKKGETVTVVPAGTAFTRLAIQS